MGVLVPSLSILGPKNVEDDKNVRNDNVTVILDYLRHYHKNYLYKTHLETC